MKSRFVASNIFADIKNIRKLGNITCHTISVLLIAASQSAQKKVQDDKFECWEWVIVSDIDMLGGSGRQLVVVDEEPQSTSSKGAYISFTTI